MGGRMVEHDGLAALGIDLALRTSPDLERLPPCQRPTWPWKAPASFCVSLTSKRAAVPRRARRCRRPGRRTRRRTACGRAPPCPPRHRPACPRSSPSRTMATTVQPVGLQRLVAEELGGLSDLTSSAGSAPSTRSWLAARARSRCASMARSKPAMSTVQAALARDVGGQVDREAVGVVEAEHVLAGHHPAVHAGDDLLEQLHAVLQGLAEALLLLACRAFSTACLRLGQLRIGLAHLGHQRRDHLPEEGSPLAPSIQPWRMARRMIRRST